MLQSEPKPLRSLESQESTKPKWPDWTSQNAVCVATGPSLKAQQIDYLAGCQDDIRIIAVNEAGLRQYLPLAVPWADILYAADRTWWQHYQPDFLGLRVSGEPVEGVDTIACKMLERNEPMPRAPGKLVSGSHSGFQALGLALALGATKIALLGYDCGKPGGQRNAHKNRPEKFLRDAPMDQWVQPYNRVPREWPDVEIFNCTEHTRITAFPVCELQEVFA